MYCYQNQENRINRAERSVNYFSNYRINFKQGESVWTKIIHSNNFGKT